jgi:predicted RNase H-like nuclease (RuvC/YqgF family)
MMLDQNTISGLASFGGMFLTALLGYLAAKQTNKKDVVVTDRQTLSTDEKNFREDLLNEVKGYREETRKLREEVEALRSLNTELKLENVKLSAQVQDLTLELKEFRSYEEKVGKSPTIDIIDPGEDNPTGGVEDGRVKGS